MDESDNKEGLSKNVKIIKGKNKDQLAEIEYQGEKQLDAIEKQGKKNLVTINKQEKQLKRIKNKKIIIKEVERKERSGEIVLLKDWLNNILLDYEDMNINAKGKYILKKLAKDERIINYKNLLFRTGYLIIGDYSFLKRFATLYDLLIDLLSKEISPKKAVEEENGVIRQNK